MKRLFVMFKLLLLFLFVTGQHPVRSRQQFQNIVECDSNVKFTKGAQVNYVWTDTDTLGDGAWLPISGGAGETNFPHGIAVDSSLLVQNFPLASSDTAAARVLELAPPGITGQQQVVRGCSPCDSLYHLVKIVHLRDSISSTQILNSNSSPDTIIAAPGIGKKITVLSVKYKYVYGGSGLYTLSGTIGLVEGDSVLITNNVVANMLVLSSNAYAYAAITEAPYQLGSFSNAPVVFRSQLSNPTGSTTGWLWVYIEYVIDTDGD